MNCQYYEVERGGYLIYGWVDSWHYAKPMWVIGPFSREEK